MPPGHVYMCHQLPGRALYSPCHPPHEGRELPLPCADALDTGVSSSTAGGAEAQSHLPSYIPPLPNALYSSFKATYLIYLKFGDLIHRLTKFRNHKFMSLLSVKHFDHCVEKLF